MNRKWVPYKDREKKESNSDNNSSSGGGSYTFNAPGSNFSSFGSALVARTTLFSSRLYSAKSTTFVSMAQRATKEESIRFNSNIVSTAV